MEKLSGENEVIVSPLEILPSTLQEGWWKEGLGQPLISSVITAADDTYDTQTHKTLCISSISFIDISILPDR